jgi:fumarate reductase subunit D
MTINKIAGVFWGLFTGSATICAFVLPFFIVINVTHPGSIDPKIAYTIITLGLFHAIYRLSKLSSELRPHK